MSFRILLIFQNIFAFKKIWRQSRRDKKRAPLLYSLPFKKSHPGTSCAVSRPPCRIFIEASSKVMSIKWQSLLIMTLSCTSHRGSYDEPLQGTITYPFLPTHPIGVNGQSEKVIIRSIIGNREYVVELPGSTDEYDMEVPLNEIDKESKNRVLTDPTKSDKSLVERLPQIEQKLPAESHLMDKAFGVVVNEKPEQPQSYLLGLDRVNSLYSGKKYELALIEIDNLLSDYPNSPELLKKKGTVLLKLNQIQLALEAWQQAKNLDPSDLRLSQSIDRLEKSLH